MRFHLHHDPNWQADGCWIYSTCRRCGARRLRRRYANLLGPTRRGWEALTVNRHGQSVNDSGWHRTVGAVRQA